MAKRLIRFVCRLGVVSRVCRGMDVLDGMEIVKGEGAVTTFFVVIASFYFIIYVYIVHIGAIVVT